MAGPLGVLVRLLLEAAQRASDAESGKSDARPRDEDSAELDDEQMDEEEEEEGPDSQW